MSKGITISKQFGVNPSVLKCSCCGKEFGLVLFGTSWKDENGKTAAAPKVVMTGEICNDCKSIIDKGGVFFIEVRDGEQVRAAKNPYRTGRLIAISKEAAQRTFPAVENMQPINYMEFSLFDKVFGEALKQGKEEQQ